MSTAPDHSPVQYEERPPPRALAPYVRCVWSLRVASGPDAAVPQLIVPDGCMELVLNLAAPFEQLLGDGRFVRQPRVLLVGELRRPVTTRAAGEVHLLAVRFQPGAVSTFFDAAPAELVDGMPDARGLMPPGLRAGVLRVLDAAPPERLPLLWRALDEGRRGALDPWTRRAVERLAAAEGCVGIAQLEDALGITRRHLERRFLAHVGVTPKAFAQVLRFRRALRAIEATRTDWARVAAACGYADQSHLIRDFKRYTGSPPRAFLQEAAARSLFSNPEA